MRNAALFTPRETRNAPVSYFLRLTLPPLSLHYFLFPGQSTPRESCFEESLTVPSALQRSSQPIVLFHSTANCVGSLSLRKRLPLNSKGFQNPIMVWGLNCLFLTKCPLIFGRKVIKYESFSWRWLYSLGLQIKGSSRFLVFIDSWRALSTHSGPNQALNPTGIKHKWLQLRKWK